MKPLFIIKRDKPFPHYEVHLDKIVEFRKLDGTKIGKSKVESFKLLNDNEVIEANLVEILKILNEIKNQMIKDVKG